MTHQFLLHLHWRSGLVHPRPTVRPVSSASPSLRRKGLQYGIPIRASQPTTGIPTLGSVITGFRSSPWPVISDLHVVESACARIELRVDEPHTSREALIDARDQRSPKRRDRAGTAEHCGRPVNKN